MKIRSHANARKIMELLKRKVLQGDHFRASVAAQQKLPKRFSGKDGVLFKDDLQPALLRFIARQKAT